MPQFLFRTSRSLSLQVIFSLIILCFCSPLFADNAPAFELPTTTNPVSLNSLKGKVVYLDFWASWCSPCRKSFPWMEKMQSRYKDLGLEVVAVNLDKNEEKAKEFLKQFHSNFTVAFDPEGKTAERYKVRGMPSSYLIDRNGQLHMTHIGFRESDTDELETKIRDLLKQ
jgi:cytochrome c biogenesis protein CcmG/thiol:disulfide interchange protein DsbE